MEQCEKAEGLDIPIFPFTNAFDLFGQYYLKIKIRYLKIETFLRLK